MQTRCGIGSHWGDFSEDDLSRKSTDAGNISQVDAAVSVPLFAKIERGVIALALINVRLGAFRHGCRMLGCVGQSRHQLQDLAVQLGDQLPVVAITIQ